MTEPIDITLRLSESLTTRELDDIWALTDRYVETDRATFEKKLHALPEVGLWRLRTGALAGLVSLDVLRVDWEGRRRVVFFTSSVVIDERFRGRNLVLQTGVRAYCREKVRHPLEPAYWLFDTFSYKSYLLLPRNLSEYWPRRDRPTPPAVARFIDRLARDRYGDTWLPATGVVRHGAKRLRPTTAPIDSAVLRDPDVEFFERANPGHRDGDMLVCLVPVSIASFVRPLIRSVAKRVGAPR